MTVNEVLWYVSRAAGVTSFALLTLVLTLGVLGPIRRSERRKPHRIFTPAFVTGLHRSLALGMVAFLAAHVLTAVIETFVDIGWLSIIVPFSSGYRPVVVGLGTISVDLGIAVIATALLRKRLPPRAWRVVHKAAYVLWPIAALHGLLLGVSEPLPMQAAIVTCIAVGTSAIAWRYTSAAGQRATPRDGAARPARAGAQRPRVPSSPGA